MRRTRQVTGSEEGAVAIVTALILTVLISLMAFVVDYGLVRADIRESQSAADSASQAGAGVLAENGTYQEACQASVEYLEVNLGITLSGGLCAPFAPGTFETASVTCEDRAASSLDATDNPAVVAPVYVEETVGEHTVRIQMPVRHTGDGSGATDPALEGQDYDADHDGDAPCQRIAVSVRRSRDLVFGSFAGGSGSASGFADAVSRFFILTGEEDISSLIVLDPTGCRSLEVSSNGGRLLVENVEDSAGTVIQRGLITVDSDGTDCGNNKYVMAVGGSDARLCAGVDPDNVDEVPAGSGNYVLATGFCDSLPESLRTPSVDTAVTGPDPYGKSVSTANIDNKQVEPEPISDERVTRRPVDHNYNCRASYPLSGSSGDEWHPLYESLEPCAMGRAAHMDELAEDLAEAASFTTDTSWATISGAGCSIGPGDNITIGDGTQNLYFDCNTLDVKGTLRIVPDQYVVVRGWVDASNSATDLRVNVDASGANVAQDAVMVIQGKSPGNPGNALQVGSSGDANINRTFVYAHEGAVSVNADAMRWTAPEEQGYVPLQPDGTGGEADNCVDEVAFSGYELPSPACFHKLAMWTNNTGQHQMRGGGVLDVAGVFFAPYAGRSGTSAFSLAGGTGQRLSKAQFFTYRFDLAGSSLLSMRPDPNYNVYTNDAVIGLIR